MIFNIFPNSSQQTPGDLSILLFKKALALSHNNAAGLRNTTFHFHLLSLQDSQDTGDMDGFKHMASHHTSYA